MSRSDWDPDLYGQFEDERTRPARDLLARAARDGVRVVVDLGCGPGNSTELLAARFPAAQIAGIDMSATMLASARRRLPTLTFAAADITAWVAPEPVDLLFANAALQWLPDHATLIPRLFAMLAPGGTLAVQMPANADEPSHRVMRQVANEGPWRQTLETAGALRPRPVLRPAEYYDLLASASADVDVWQTTYNHPLPSAAAIVDWVRATGLRPYLDPLSQSDARHFLQRYEAAVAEAYAARADGRRLLAFPRLFIVARRPS